MKDKLIEYYDYLTRLAASKCRVQADAQDLVSDTILAALAFLHRGGVIEYPKTWLANTLMHKYADMLRSRSGAPVVVSLELSEPPTDDFFERYLASEEAASVRRELNYLAHITRETLMRYYVRGESIAAIAAALKIPEGTVKSRLDAGRRQVKKGLETMEEKRDYLPGRLHIWNSGSTGAKNEPVSLVEGDLIVQNLLMIAFDKPLTAAEIARRIGIPTVYVEPILGRLVNGELMVKTDSERYYTDFLIDCAEAEPDAYRAKTAFVEAHYPILRETMGRLIAAYRALGLPLRERPAMKLERYLVLKALQNFQLFSVPELCSSVSENPRRRDGGTWTAAGCAYPADYAEPTWKKEADGNHIWGGHRTSGAETADTVLRLFEFDTPFWDSPHRFAVCGYDNYFHNIHRFLWQIESGAEIGGDDFPKAMPASVERYETLGLFTHIDGRLTVDIPVLERETFTGLELLTKEAYESLCRQLGAAYREWVLERRKPVPAHLVSVPSFLRYTTNDCIPMLTERRLCEEGLHMQGVDYCCPPMVLIYQKK